MTTYTMQEGAEGGGWKGGKLMFGLGVGRAANVLDSEVWDSGRFADKPYIYERTRSNQRSASPFTGTLTLYGSIVPIRDH